MIKIIVTSILAMFLIGCETGSANHVVIRGAIIGAVEAADSTEKHHQHSKSQHESRSHENKEHDRDDD